MAKKKQTAASLGEDQVTAYYERLRQSKIAAGLSGEQAAEVTARQRETDAANGVELEIDVPDETPAA